MLKFVQKGRVLAAALLMGLLIAAFAGCSAPARQSVIAPADKTGAPAQPEGQDLVIPVSDISDKALFIPVEADGVNMEVIAVQAPDGSIRTAFNTCQGVLTQAKAITSRKGTSWCARTAATASRWMKWRLQRAAAIPCPSLRI